MVTRRVGNCRNVDWAGDSTRLRSTLDHEDFQLTWSSRSSNGRCWSNLPWWRGRVTDRTFLCRLVSLLLDAHCLRSPPWNDYELSPGIFESLRVVPLPARRLWCHILKLGISSTFGYYLFIRSSRCLSRTGSGLPKETALLIYSITCSSQTGQVMKARCVFRCVSKCCLLCMDIIMVGRIIGASSTL